MSAENFVNRLKEKKKRGEKIVMLTAYDAPMAQAVDEAGVDIILVGDSVANVVLGLDSTREVGMDIMLHHARAVRRGVRHAVVVADLPFELTGMPPAQAADQARCFISEVGCEAVKCEWFDHAPELTALLRERGVPVMGHVGLTPQAVETPRGFKVQGRDAQSAREVVERARAFEDKGAFALVLECVPDRLAGWITERSALPTIGIGAGPGCDGQVLVTHDLLGLFDRYRPKFVKVYAETGAMIRKGIRSFGEDVRGRNFPTREHSYAMSDEQWQKFLAMNP